MTEVAPDSELRPRRRVGRFELYSEIASGGMATIHLGRVIGASDFARVVAIKRLHPQFAKDPEFVRMFLDEARLVTRVRHPNVTPTIDLIEEKGELFIVMEYVEGETFHNLLRTARKRKEQVPLGVALRIMTGTLHGLHAAHEARDEKGEPLGLVHRDVSPDNIMVGTDGFARLLDFGIARALGRHGCTKEGMVKGKLAYMTPEQILGDPITRQADVFSASAVLWQALTGRRLFKGSHVGEYTHKILNMPIVPPSEVVRALPKKLDPIVLRGLKRDPAERWPTAQRMAEAIEAVGSLGPQRELGRWVERLAPERMRTLTQQVAAIEAAPRGRTPHSLPPDPPDGIGEEADLPLESEDGQAPPSREPLVSGIELRDDDEPAEPAGADNAEEPSTHAKPVALPPPRPPPRKAGGATAVDGASFSSSPPAPATALRMATGKLSRGRLGLWAGGGAVALLVLLGAIWGASGDDDQETVPTSGTLAPSEPPTATMASEPSAEPSGETSSESETASESETTSAPEEPAAAEDAGAESSDAETSPTATATASSIASSAPQSTAGPKSTSTRPKGHGTSLYGRR